MKRYCLYKRNPDTEPVHRVPSFEVDLIEVIGTIMNRDFDLNEVRICEANSAQHTMATISAREQYSIDWDEELEVFWRTEAKPLHREFANIKWENYDQAAELLEEPLQNIIELVRTSSHFDGLYVGIGAYLDSVIDSYQECNESTLFDILTKKFNLKGHQS